MIEQLSPETSLDPARFESYESGILRTPIFNEALRLVDRTGMTVCDVGGGTGVFLAAIAENRAKFDPTLHLMEVVEDYRARLASPKIHFDTASILDESLPSDQFDLVTCRHLIHHLVGASHEDTLALQKRGLQNLLRITKPGGHLLILERVNQVRAFGRTIFELSKIASHLNIKSETFQTGQVVVNFLNTAWIRDALLAESDTTPLNLIEESYRAQNPELKWKLTVLMAKSGDGFFVVEKCPSPQSSNHD